MGKGWIFLFMCAAVSVVSDVADAAVGYIGSGIRGGGWDIENYTGIGALVVGDGNTGKGINLFVLPHGGSVTGGG